MNIQEAIGRLRSMFDAYEHEHRGIGPDMAEVGIFLDWAEKNAGEQPARTIDNVTDCHIFAANGYVNTARRGGAYTSQQPYETATVTLNVGQRMIVERVDQTHMRLEVLP